MNPGLLIQILEYFKAFLEGEFSGVIDEAFVHSIENPGNVSDARLGDKGLLVGDSLDLGAITLAELNAFQFSANLTSKLQPFIGLTQAGLKKALRDQTIHVVLTQAEINEINTGTIAFYSDKLLALWDPTARLAFDQLPDKPKTVAYLIFREKNTLSENYKKRLTEGRWLDTVYMLFEGRATNRNISIGNYLLSYLLPDVSDINAEKFNAYYAKNILKSVLKITNDSEMQITFDASKTLNGSDHLDVLDRLKKTDKTGFLFFHPSENSIFFSLPDFLYLANGIPHKGLDPKKNIVRVLPATSAIADQVIQQVLKDLKDIVDSDLTESEKEIEKLNLESMAYRRIIIGSFIRSGSHSEGMCLDFNLLQTYSDITQLSQDNFEKSAAQENTAAIEMVQFISDVILTMDPKFFSYTTFGIPQQTGFLRRNDGEHVFKCLGQPRTTTTLDFDAPRGLFKSEIVNNALRTTMNKNTNSIIINDNNNHLHLQVTQVGR